MNLIGKEIDLQEAVKPISINLEDIQEEKLVSIASRYKENGFAIFKFENDLTSDEAVLKLAELLNLQDPYVPDHYKKNQGALYGDRKLNTINSGLADNHKAFHQKNNQDLHSDGTVHEIGFIKTTVLFCESEASIGGDTILFNSVKAFKELEEVNPKAAEALMHPESLTRMTDIGQNQSRMTGPAFAIENGEVISRFTLDHTAKWEESFKKIDGLEEGYNYLKNLAHSESKYFIQLALKSGEGIIFANDKIAHGRLAFENTGDNVRKMVRGLFLHRPEVK